MRTPIRQARREIEAHDPDRRDAVRQELQAIGASQITDVVQWDVDAFGKVTNVTVVASSELSERARRSIKKIKVTPTKNGNEIEIEMHDKLSALRVLARSEGLLDGNGDDDKRPTLVGINIKGPQQVTEEKENEPGSDRD
jgi:hypothetical protein